MLSGSLFFVVQALEREFAPEHGRRELSTFFPALPALTADNEVVRPPKVPVFPALNKIFSCTAFLLSFIAPRLSKNAL